jgi:hypothetical protein
VSGNRAGLGRVGRGSESDAAVVALRSGGGGGHQEREGDEVLHVDCVGCFGNRIDWSSGKERIESKGKDSGYQVN